MIVKIGQSWLSLIFTYQGSSLTHTWRRIAAVTSLSVLVTVAWEAVTLGWFVAPYTVPINLTTTPFSLVGVALGIFLGFRNNASYDRFWEGRKLWGALVNTSRNFTRQLLTLVTLPGPESEAEEQDLDALRTWRREMVYRTAGYVHAVRHHLRGTEPFEDLADFIPAAEVEALKSLKNVPLGLQMTLGRRIQWAWKRGWVHDLHVPNLDRQLDEFLNIQGGCERIKATPIPFTYTVLIHRIVFFYCVLLPFGIVSTVGVLTPLVVFMISHAFFGLDDIGDEIEEPFGMEPNDLPLAAISRMIEVNLKQSIEDEAVPPLLEPVDELLT